VRNKTSWTGLINTIAASDCQTTSG